MDFANPCPAALTGASSQMFVTLINTLLTSQCMLSSHDFYPADVGPNLKDGEEFDFIVVGSGSAGSVVADRLSENPNWKVLLLEAGDYPSSTTEVPAPYFTLIKTKEDWGYDLEPSETSCLGVKNGKCRCPRGKVLGGTSSINGMHYVRGHRRDYDQWAEEGNEGWDYESVLKHFKKVEDFQGVDDDEYYGKGGDLKLMHYTNFQPIHKSMIDGFEELGYGKYEEKKPVGYFKVASNIHDGVRQSAAKAFLSKGRERSNLHVALNAQVSRLLIDSNLSVKGVEVRLNEKILQLISLKEVILSAGAVNSPQILMNSGIGPQSHLTEVGIPTVRDLQVGQHLQDHAIFSGLLLSLDDNALVPKTLDDVVDDLYQYFRHKSGPMAQPGIIETLFFLNTKNNSNYPNMLFYQAEVYKNDLQGGLKVLHNSLSFPDEVVQVQSESNKRSHSFFIGPVLSDPKSVGRILLRSKDPFDTPKIVSNFLSDANGEDLQAFLESIRFVQNLTRTQALAAHQAQIVFPNLANCRSLTVDSDDYWKCTLRNTVSTGYHLAGTCKMGPKSDPDAVVDSRLRVHGMNGVRVVDASIMPKIISCCPNAAAIMIGDKGASMIKEDWEKDHQTL